MNTLSTAAPAQSPWKDIPLSVIGSVPDNAVDTILELFICMAEEGRP